ncbi:MAG TPA: acyl-CoA dehydrogenase family protein, partial [Acidobacteriota bacterium]
MEQNRFDVIVVGGGPAGITAATALGKSGFSVLVCEAAVYAGAENWSGAVYFTENLEADDAFGRETVERAPFERRLIERGFYLYNGHSLLGATLRDPGVFRSCYTVLRPVYDRYLAEVSREHGVVLLCETTVQSLIRHRGRVVGVHTERGPAYADVVFLAEGDASHLVTQEGYETVGADAAGGNGGGRSHGAGGHDGARGRGAGDGDRGGRGQTGGSSLDAGDHGGPHFLQGIKEVITLPPGAIEERFGLPEAGGGAYEMLLRNGSRGGRTVRLNMGGFLYTNRDSISLGLVLPVDNLSRGFDGDHNLLMEWFKGLPEVARWIEGGEVTSYGAKIIRGGGAREIPRLVDDGLAIGGAASGIGIDFPYPNFTGPATAMGLLFARAVGAIAADHGGPGGGRGSVDPGGGGTGVGSRSSPFTAAALEHAYLKPLRQTHYYRNVERLADWPGYVERTRFFFERQLDVVNGMAFVVSRPDIGGPRRWWEALRLKRRVLGKRFGSALGDLRANSAALGLGRAAWAGLGAGTVGRWLLNTVAALLPSSRARTGGDAVTGVAEAEGPGGARFRMVFRVMAGAEPAGRMPLLARWYWKRFAPSLAGAFADVYTNDDEPLDDKLPRALGRVIGCLSVWDLLAAVVMAPAAVATMAAQAAVEAFQYFVLKKDLGEFREQLVARLLEGNRARLRLDDDAVEIRTSYEHKLGTIRYREGEHSHIKVMWPDELAARGELRESPLWSVCPAKVYELEVNPRGMPGVIVNFDNCVKCETCWRATPDVHWSRATQQRLIYETYTPAHGELRRYLLGRPEPVPRLSRSPGFWEEYWAATTVPVALGADSNSSVSSGTIDDRDHAAVREADASATEARQAGIELHAGARVALAGVAAELDRFAVTLEGYSTALGGSPLTLERGQRRYLEELLGVAARRFASARAIWLTDPLAPLRDRFGEPGAGLWGDAADRVEELSRHAAARRYFWSDVLGKQLRDHHLRGLRRLLELAGWSNAEAERAAIVRSGFLDQPDAAGAGKEASGGTPTAAGTGPETEGGPFDDARSREVGGGGPLDAVSARVWAAEWRRIEGRPAELDGVRRGIREWRDEHLDGAALRALEEQEPPGPELRGWLAGQLQAAVATGRPPAGERGRDRASGSAYGRRDVLLEELAAVDPSLAVLAGQHLLACDLLAGAAGSDTLAGDLRAGRALATVVSQGSISNRPLVSGDDVVDQGEALAAGAAELHGEAPLVAAALADWLLVVRSERCYLVPAGDPGLRLEPVGCIGLLGAGVRRAAFEGCVVPAERIFISAALAAVTGVAPQSFEVGKSADSSGAREAAGLMGEAVGPDATAATAIPPAGEPYTDLLPIAVADHLAIVRGAGDYLTRRAREHAASRVQFPGSMEDEAGRDSIAKFGAVKQLLAEMEARRILVETLSIIDPGPADDPWVGAAVRKVCAADAFGPAEGSFGYNCGQIFGGTSFSEDDNIAKYYRDSSPFRFLLAHDDALRVEIGRRRLAAVREGRSLIPVSADETAWLDEAAGAGSLSDIVSSWRAAAEEIESWAAGAASSGAAGGDGDGSIEPSTDDGFRNAGDGLAELICHQAGEAVLQVLAVKACILRTAWRLECGLAAQATLQATALLSDRLVAAAPALVAGAGLLSDALRVGRETIAEGDFEPGAAIPDAEPYDAVLATDHAAESGEWLIRPFDAGHLRYLPEILWNDAGLRAFRERLEAAQRRRFVEPLFDGLPYGRYLEKIHIVPAEDLDYLIERGYLRMPIPAELGGEGAHKAEYYILCEMTGRFGDAALSLAIMANTSIGTTPVLLGLGQDLPRARAELEKVKADPALLGDIRAGLDAIIGGLARPDLEALQRGYLALSELVKARILKSSVLKYIGAGFLRAFFEAGAAGQQRDLDGFAAGLREARQRIDEILEGVDGRLLEYPRRVRAHELFLKLISAGYISAFALTEPTAGSDSGGVKTTAKLTRRRVHEDDDGVLWFWLDEEGKTGRRNLLDADRLELDYERRRILYRWSADVDPSEIDHDGYDYEKDRAGRWRAYDHGGRRVDFTDIAQIRSDDSGQRWYEFWELSGAKMWITNGRFAHCFALYARTEPEGVTGFMVDRHAEGLVVGADEEKLGQRGSPTNELSLTGVRVPRECIIGFRGRGQVNALETLNAGRTGLAVTTRSTIQEMIEDALDFLGSETEGQDVPAGRYPRQQGPPTPLQVFWMGRLTEELMTTAALSNELIGLFDHPLTRDTRMESAIGKYYGSEAEHEGIDWMERLRGLDGQTHRHRIEKTRRDARVLNIYEGTNEVQRFLLLRDLAQRVLPAWQAAGGKATGGQSAAATSSAPGDEASGVPGLAAGYAAAAATHAGAHPDLRERLEGAKSRLLSRLAEAQGSFGDIVWSNVNLQPCFFRLVEIAGLIKVMDALL